MCKQQFTALVLLILSLSVTQRENILNQKYDLENLFVVWEFKSH